MEFRKITAIIQSDRLEAVEECLKKLGVPGVSVSKVKGFGEYANYFEPDWLCAHARIEVFIGAVRSEEVVRAVMEAAHTGMEGDGIIAVLPVESVYHIRSKEKCQYDACQ